MFKAASPNLQLWYAKAGEHTIEAERAVVALLGATESLRLKRLGSAKKKREYLLSRALMRHALSELFTTPAKGWLFTDQLNAAPQIDNLPKNTFVSLSHSDGYIFFALSVYPIGIDVERLREKNQLLDKAALFMSKQEVKVLKEKAGCDRRDYFYAIWCAKEGYFKANPSKQQRLEFANLSIDDEIACGGWSLITEQTSEVYYATVIKNQGHVVEISHHQFGH